MQIKTEQDMLEFCKFFESIKEPKEIQIYDSCSQEYVSQIEKIQDDLIAEGVIPAKPLSHLQQGILVLYKTAGDRGIQIKETPLLFPNPKIIERSDLKNYFGAMTGTLVNCYDLNSKTFLFHMRGRDIVLLTDFRQLQLGWEYLESIQQQQQKEN